MLLAVVSDPRLVLARLAEELVVLRHARELPPAEAGRRALEARAIYAPLANRLGVWQLKWELEDLAFRYLEPEEYKRVAAALNERRADRERYIETLCAELRAGLAAAGIAAEVYGRPKHIYSIYRKMQRKQLAFEQLFDVRAVRLVVASIPECYAALGIVHGLWPYIPGEFDDYVATPKGNGYRSIHTAVIGPHGRSVEVQIRTAEMHEHAELGVAAHWTYKEGGLRDAQYQRKIEWVRRLLAPHDGLDAGAIADRELSRIGVRPEQLGALTAELKAPDTDHLYQLLGEGEITVTQLVQAAMRLTEPPRPPLRPARPAATRRRASPVEIEGVGDLPTTLARCCAPLRPQPIDGYLTLGRGVTVHRSDCAGFQRMSALKPDRVLNVEWSSAESGALAVELAVSAYDRRGLLRDLTDVLAVERLSIDATSSRTDHDAGIAYFDLSVAVDDLEQLARVP